MVVFLFVAVGLGSILDLEEDLNNFGFVLNGDTTSRVIGAE